MKKSEEKNNTVGKTFRGTVVSNKMKDTAVVNIDRFVKHPRYGKYINRRKKFHVHDPGNSAQVGEVVTIKETKPISKTKFYIIVK